MFYPLGKNSEKPYGGGGTSTPPYVVGLKKEPEHCCHPQSPLESKNHPEMDGMKLSTFSCTNTNWKNITTRQRVIFQP